MKTKAISRLGALTHEVGSEGGSPGEYMELLRATSGAARGSEGTETMPGDTRMDVVERRDAVDTLIKKA